MPRPRRGKGGESEPKSGATRSAILTLAAFMIATAAAVVRLFGSDKQNTCASHYTGAPAIAVAEKEAKEEPTDGDAAKWSRHLVAFLPPSPPLLPILFSIAICRKLPFSYLLSVVRRSHTHEHSNIEHTDRQTETAQRREHLQALRAHFSVCDAVWCGATRPDTLLPSLKFVLRDSDFIAVHFFASRCLRPEQRSADLLRARSCSLSNTRLLKACGVLVVFAVPGFPIAFSCA